MPSDPRLTPCLTLSPAPAAPHVYNFTSPRTNTTYYLNTAMNDAGSGEQFCQRHGGHLAIYTSAKEQLEVEAAFTKQGGLIPVYHNIYWFGLRAQLWPDFRWPDQTVAAPRENGTYSAWAATQPDNAGNGQLCTAGNYSGQLKSGAWGWSDESCGMQLVYVCEVSGEWLQWLAVAACAAWSCADCAAHAEHRSMCVPVVHADVTNFTSVCTFYLANSTQQPRTHPSFQYLTPTPVLLPPAPTCSPLSSHLPLGPQRPPPATSPAWSPRTPT